MKLDKKSRETQDSKRDAVALQKLVKLYEKNPTQVLDDMYAQDWATVSYTSVIRALRRADCHAESFKRLSYTDRLVFFGFLTIEELFDAPGDGLQWQLAVMRMNTALLGYVGWKHASGFLPAVAAIQALMADVEYDDDTTPEVSPIETICRLYDSILGAGGSAAELLCV